MKLIVTLKGQAKDAQSSVAGIYVLEPKPINGKSHWLQNSGSYAIWYRKLDVEFWAIGSLGERALILSADKVSSPQEVTTWQYFDGNNYFTSDDILVEPGIIFGNYFFTR